MREILFRGKRVDNGEWVEGDYYKIPAPPVCFKEDLKTVRDKHYIILENPNSCPDWGMSRQMVQVEVIPETVREYTGLTDKNGTKIFEGDIVVTRFSTGQICAIGDIQFACGVYGVEWTANKINRGMIGCFGQLHNLRKLDDDIIDNIEVIGNIHDNPELLKEDKQ